MELEEFNKKREEIVKISKLLISSEISELYEYENRILTLLQLPEREIKVMAMGITFTPKEYQEVKENLIKAIREEKKDSFSIAS